MDGYEEITDVLDRRLYECSVEEINRFIGRCVKRCIELLEDDYDKAITNIDVLKKEGDIEGAEYVERGLSMQKHELLRYEEMSKALKNMYKH